MDSIKIRWISGLLTEALIVAFGVFMFSDFIYRGLTLKDNIWPLFSAGTFTQFMDGLFQLFGSSLSADWFGEFSKENINTNGFGNILFGETIWPALLTWSSVGFLSEAWMPTKKQGIKMASIFFGLLFLFWIIMGFFAGADITGIFVTNIITTLGKIFTAAIGIIIGASIGMLIIKHN